MRASLPRLVPILAVLAAFATCARAQEGILTGDVEWSGVVRVSEDILVAPGAVLTVRPGTRVLFARALGTRTEPVFWSPGTELAVAGRLRVEGTPEAPVTFEGDGEEAGAWGGVVAAPGAEVVLHQAVVRGAQEGLLCVGARCRLEGVRVEAAEYGLVLGPGSEVDATGVALSECRVGLLDARQAPAPVPGIAVSGAADAAVLQVPAPARAAAPVAARGEPRPRTEILGELAVEADEVWSGEVILNARVTVVPGAVLTLTPGTRVAFRKADPHGAGLGSGELLILGGIRSLGLPHAPVVFESAEPAPAPGDWDKVSLISAESADNEFRYTVFRHGTQALHAHFSSFFAYRCLFEANLRAGQFQESQDARLEGCVFVNNKQALRFRDSTVAVRDSVFLDNLYAVHAFRCELTFAGNTVEGSSLGGFLARESTVRFLGNRLARNRDGVRMREEGARAEVRGNRFEASAEGHLSLSRVEGLVEGNDFEAAGLDLVSLEDSGVRLRGNRFGPSGRDAVHLKGPGSVDARGNYWGPGPVAARIHDRTADPALGAVSWDPPLNSAPMLDLPRKTW